jgi:hypothetical protein
MYHNKNHANILKMSAIIFVVSIVFFVSLSCAALSYMLFPKEQTSTAPTPQVPVITETEHTPVPFSYNVPIDSHMNYKNDVVIVVEHPDEHVTIGMAPR